MRLATLVARVTAVMANFLFACAFSLQLQSFSSLRFFLVGGVSASSLTGSVVLSTEAVCSPFTSKSISGFSVRK